MKKILLLAGCSLLATCSLLAQNPFGNNAFSTALKKIDSDRANAFVQNKGTLLRTISSYYSIYNATIALPGMDSGRVSVPVTAGRLFSNYFFKPSTDITDIIKRAGQLSDAVQLHMNGKAVLRKVRDTVGQFRYYKHQLYFDNPAEPAYEIIYFLSKAKYHLILRAYAGTAPAPPPVNPLDDAELEQKIRTIISSMDNHFVSEKGAKTDRSNAEYEEFESKTRIGNMTGTIKVRSAETSFYFSADYNVLPGTEAALRFYEKLKSIIAATGRFRFDPERVEVSRKSIFGQQPNPARLVAAYTVVIDCYTNSAFPSVGILIIRKKNFN